MHDFADAMRDTLKNTKIHVVKTIVPAAPSVWSSSQFVAEFFRVKIESFVWVQFQVQGYDVCVCFPL